MCIRDRLKGFEKPPEHAVTDCFMTTVEILNYLRSYSSLDVYKRQRLRDGRQVDMVAPTRLTINPNLWDDKAEQVKSCLLYTSRCV